jgi:hypothetical protein
VDLPDKGHVMTRGHLLRTVAAAVLAAVLLAPPAQAAPHLPSLPSAGEIRGLFATAWSVLGPLLQAPRAALDNRCGIDPNGGISCGPAGTAADTRCGIDPDGRASCGPGL